MCFGGVGEGERENVVRDGEGGLGVGLGGGRDWGLLGRGGLWRGWSSMMLSRLWTLLVARESMERREGGASRREPRENADVGFWGFLCALGLGLDRSVVGKERVLMMLSSSPSFSVSDQVLGGGLDLSSTLALLAGLRFRKRRSVRLVLLRRRWMWGVSESLGVE